MRSEIASPGQMPVPNIPATSNPATVSTAIDPSRQPAGSVVNRISSERGAIERCRG